MAVQVTPTEDGLWAIAMQLLSAVHAVHVAGYNHLKISYRPRVTHTVHVSPPSTCHPHRPRVHVAGSAVRSLDASHVILTDRNTVRVSQSGLADVMRPDHRSVQQLQATPLPRPRVTIVNVSPSSTCDHRPRVTIVHV